MTTTPRASAGCPSQRNVNIGERALEETMIPAEVSHEALSFSLYPAVLLDFYARRNACACDVRALRCFVVAFLDITDLDGQRSGIPDSRAWHQSRIIMARGITLENPSRKEHTWPASSTSQSPA